MTEKLIDITARLTVTTARMLGRLPDFLLLSVLKIGHGISAIGSKDPDAPDPLAEIIDILKNDPEGNRAIRRLMTDNRTTQFASMIRGLLRHHVFARGRVPDPNRNPGPGSESARPARGKKGRTSGCTVGVLGEGYESERLLEAYSRIPGCRARRLEKLTPGEIPAIDILEAAHCTVAGAAAGAAHLAELLGRGIAVSAPGGSIASRDEFVSLAGVSKRGGAPFRLRYPYLYYAPVRAVRSLLEGDAIGEVGTVRIQATIGGSGGRYDPVPPGETDYLAHPAFDHFPLLAALGGAPAEVGAYLQTMDGKRGGQGLVSCRFEVEGRYGVLECCYAPGIRFVSTAFPYDLQAEISGTDGIIWLKRGMARRSLEAPVHVRAGRTAYSLGVESGLPAEWEQVYRNAAAEMMELFYGNGSPLITKHEASSAIAAREAALFADARRKRVIIGT